MTGIGSDLAPRRESFEEERARRLVEPGTLKPDLSTFLTPEDPMRTGTD
jgi:hypothetical protein